MNKWTSVDNYSVVSWTLVTGLVMVFILRAEPHGIEAVVFGLCAGMVSLTFQVRSMKKEIATLQARLQQDKV